MKNTYSRGSAGLLGLAASGMAADLRGSSKTRIGFHEAGP